MTDFTEEKGVVRSYYTALDAAEACVADVISAHVTDDFVWRGYHPFNELNATQLAAEFWNPLRRALSALNRREDIFFAGKSSVGTGATWVVSMGNLMGLFDNPWLGIPATRKMVLLRYCEFNRISNGRIAESAMFFDIPHLMMQAGLEPFPCQTAAHLVMPGPKPHDGLLLSPQQKAEGRLTLNLIEAMIADLGQWKSDLPLEDELRRTWAEDMIWWGPAGIGASFTVPRYAEQHAIVFRQSFGERSATNHIARLAEGNYGGFFGWPNFSARPTGQFMGLDTAKRAAEFRVIDIYRRDGDKLAENWIFIDFLHFWKSQGVDILGGLCGETHGSECSGPE